MVRHLTNLPAATELTILRARVQGVWGGFQANPGANRAFTLVQLWIEWRAHTCGYR
jgi:hypothetical protein